MSLGSQYNLCVFRVTFLRFIRVVRFSRLVCDYMRAACVFFFLIVGLCEVCAFFSILCDVCTTCVRTVLFIIERLEHKVRVSSPDLLLVLFVSSRYPPRLLLQSLGMRVAHSFKHSLGREETNSEMKTGTEINEK